MRYLAIVAFLFAAVPLTACGTTEEHTTVVATPGSTVVAPDGSKVVDDDH